MKKIFILLLAGFCASAQYKNLVLEGAGIRGLAYVGALQELDDRKLLGEIERVGGTSAGALTAMAISVGYSPAEILCIISEMDFGELNDGKYFFIGGMVRMNKHYGWYRGEKLNKWIGDLLEKKTGNADITFEQLKEKGYKELYITGTNLTTQQLVIFSAETYPTMKVRDAVRISVSVPMYYAAVFIDEKGNVIRKPGKDECVNVCVDGGIAGNFPIHMFDKDSVNTMTLGLRIDTDEQIKYDLERKGLAPVPVNCLRDYMAAFYSFTLENLNRGKLTEEDWKRTISISSGNIGPKVKRLSPEEKELLIGNGRKAVIGFLEPKNLNRQ